VNRELDTRHSSYPRLLICHSCTLPSPVIPAKAGIHYYEEGARAMVVTVLPLTPARTWYQARTITHGASIAETAWCGASVRG